MALNDDLPGSVVEKELFSYACPLISFRYFHVKLLLVNWCEKLLVQRDYKVLLHQQSQTNVELELLRTVQIDDKIIFLYK